MEPSTSYIVYYSITNSYPITHEFMHVTSTLATHITSLCTYIHWNKVSLEPA